MDNTATAQFKMNDRVVDLGVTFEINGNGYQTDQETLELLRVIVPRAKASDDFSAVIAVMALGEKSGRIRLLGKA